MAKSREYWERRFTLLEDAQTRRSAEYFAELEKQYRKAAIAVQKDIDRWYARLGENNELTMQGVRKLLNRDELEEFKWNVMEYIEKGRTANVSDQWMKELENASARFHISRLEAIKMQMQNHVEMLYGNEYDEISAHMEKIYTEGYYHTAYEIQKGFNIGYDLMKLDADKVEKVLSKPWAADGANFSSRIWTHKAQLVSELHNGLTQAIIRGQHPHKVTEMIAKRFDVSKGKAGRLVMTESAFFNSASNRDCYKDLGVEKYEVCATLDIHTSDLCESLDGKVFDMKDYQVGATAPPFHVWCRTTTVPFFDDEFELDTQRAARDEEGKTYYVPGNMKYEDWKKSFVDGGSKDGMTHITPENQEYVNLFESIVGRKPNADEMDYTTFDLESYFLFGEFPEKVEEVVVDFSKMNMSELKQYVAENIETPFIGFENMKLQYAQETVSTIQEFEKKMGGTIEGLKIEFGNVRDNAYAHYDKNTKTLHLKKSGNLEKKSIEENKRALEKTGQVRNATTTYSGTIWHELGHAIDDDTGEFLSRKISEDDELLKKSFKISTYATSYPAVGSPRASEAFAENFAAYMDGGANAKDVPTDIIIHIEGYFSDKKRMLEKVKVAEEVLENTGKSGKIEIDELTPCLRRLSDNKIVNTTVVDVSPTKAEFKDWEFDWTLPQKNGYTVRAVKADGDDRIQGMVAIKPDPQNYAINLDIVEAAPFNNPHNKKFTQKEYAGVGGHLFAEAVKESMLQGYDGYVYFKAKTNLIQHYENELGAVLINPQERIMAIDERSAKVLYDKYYKSE